MSMKETIVMRRFGLVLVLMVGVMGCGIFAGCSSPSSDSGSGTGEGHWNQFRGPGGGGLGGDDAAPVKFDVGKARWSRALPSGHSSPVFWGEKLFITGIEGGKFETLCLDRETGDVLWRTEAPRVKVELHHPTSSAAASTPYVDGERVYVYYGSFGLLCYDLAGKELWKLKVRTPQNQHGTATSPIAYDGLVYLIHDSIDGDSYVLGVNAKTGKVKWKTERKVFSPNWSTPAIWQRDGGAQLVILGGGMLKGYEPLTGKELWTVEEMGAPIAVPVVGDSVLYVSAASGTQAGVNKSPLRWSFYTEFDKNSDGKIHVTEIPADKKLVMDPDLPEQAMPARSIVRWMDKDRDGAMSEAEFTAFLKMTNLDVRSSIRAIRAGGKVNVGVDEVWKYERSVPHMTSSIYYGGRVYMAKAGGVVTCLDGKTGKRIYAKRLGGRGGIASSPVVANGNVYVCSLDGVVTVFEAGDEGKVVGRSELGEAINATPAIVEGVVYLRVGKHLHAFSN